MLLEEENRSKIKRQIERCQAYVEAVILNFGLTPFVEKKIKLVYYENGCGIS